MNSDLTAQYLHHLWQVLGFSLFAIGSIFALVFTVYGGCIIGSVVGGKHGDGWGFIAGVLTYVHIAVAWMMIGEDGINAVMQVLVPYFHLA